MKIALQNKHFTNDDRYQYINWKACLPFLENKRAVLIHRPRAISTVAKNLLFACIEKSLTNRSPFQRTT